MDKGHYDALRHHHGAD